MSRSTVAVTKSSHGLVSSCTCTQAIYKLISSSMTPELPVGEPFALGPAIAGSCGSTILSVRSQCRRSARTRSLVHVRQTFLRSVVA